MAKRSNERPNPGYRVTRRENKNGGGKKMGKRKVFFQLPGAFISGGIIERAKSVPYTGPIIIKGGYWKHN